MFARPRLFGLILALALLGSAVGAARAQTKPPYIVITKTDVRRAPTIGLTVFGVDVNGRPIDFANQYISITHNGVRLLDSNVRVSGVDPVGALTVFLIDITPGVTDQLDQIKQTIERFADTQYMVEGVDYVAVYEVDAITALELLAPTPFQNSLRNLTGGDIRVMQGPTALVDSLGELITRIPTLKPRPEMAASIIVISDGTDALSRQFEPQRIPDLARERGVTLYTVWLANRDLTFGLESGREYLRSLALGTNGIETALDNPAQIGNIYAQIAQRRNHTVVDYVVDDLQAGVFTVELSLPDNPAVPPATAQVTIGNSIPRVSIDVPEDQRVITLPNVDDPVRLRFPTTVTWLDGVQRAVAEATLFVNGAEVLAIPPAELASVRADVPLQFGENAVQIVLRDDAGQEARSARLLLTVAEGDRDIPAALGGGGTWLRWLLLAGLALGLLLVLGVIFRVGWQRARSADLLGRLRALRDRRAPDAAPTPTAAERPAPRPRPAAATPPPAAADQTAVTQVNPTVQRTRPTPAAAGSRQAGIEVLEALSKTPVINPINRPEFLIGRSTTVDLSFANDPTVSRIHATIVQDGDVYRIYDEQSTSGTYVNDREVPEYGLQLADGDEIHIGAVHLRFRSGRP